MNLKDVIMQVFEEDDIVKYFNKKDWDEFKDNKCIECGKSFQKDDDVVSDIKGNLYHKECFDKKFNKDQDYKTRQKVQPGE